MIVTSHESIADVSNGGILTTRSYRLESMKLMIELLTKKFYNHKLQTMVQEYIANAIDANREAGNSNKPIQIILPTVLDAHIYISDSGPGLTEERIDSTFTSFGGSTKNEDPDDIGGYGLGAKIGLAYGDSFTVISRVDGVESTYLTFINKTGCADMATLNVEPTEKPNGVIIKIAIMRHDFEDARLAVERATYFSKVAPEVLNGTVRHFNEPIISTMWYGDVPFGNGYNDVFAIVGGIPYHVTSGSVPIISKIKFFGNKSLCLFFDVSEIEVAVNRETLQYSSQTIDTITHVIQGIMDANQEAIAFASDVPHFADKCRFIADCYTRVGAPEQTFVRVNPFLYARFSYMDRIGSLMLLHDTGCRTAVVKVHKSGTVRESIKHFIEHSAGHIKYVQDDDVVIAPLDKRSAAISLSPSGEKYVLLTSDDIGVAMEKAKFRIMTLADIHYSFKLVVTANKQIYDFLMTQVGYTSVNYVEETLPEKRKKAYGSRSCGFTDVDVKDIYSRNRTMNIHDLTPESDMWCLFSERNDAVTLFNTHKAQLPELYEGKQCVYLTAKQVKFIQKENKIKHYSVFLKAQIKQVPTALYGKMQEELDKYNTVEDIISAVRSSGGHLLRDYETLLGIYEEHHKLFPAGHLIHDVFKVSALASSFDRGVISNVMYKMQQYNQVASKGRGTMLRYFRKMGNDYKDKCLEVNQKFFETYPLISCIDYSNVKYSRRKMAGAMNMVVNHLANYLNGECL